MNYKKPKATLLHASPLILAELAGRVCYDSFHLSENESVRNFPNTYEVPEDIEESKLVDNLVNVHMHESTVEHINLTYFIKDISREIIIELNRHRIGIATSQESSRYTMEDLVEAWIDYRDDSENENWTKFIEVVGDSIVHAELNLITSTAEYLASMFEEYDREETLVKGLTGGAKKKQNDRLKRCLPESFLMQGLWTFNLRALKHLVELRLSGAAYYGIRELTAEIMRVTPHKYRILIDKKYKKEYEANLKETN